MIIGLQTVLRSAEFKRIFLRVLVQEKINLIIYFIACLAERPAYLRNIRPNYLMWEEAILNLLELLEGVFQSSDNQWLVWRLPVISTTSQRLLTNDNPRGDLKINNLELVSYVSHLNISTPLMASVNPIATKENNMASEGWA